MKKCMFKGMALLTMGFAFVACSHEGELYNENAVIEDLTNQYKENFEKKYGKIDPNQSWDFSTNDVVYFTGSPEAKTRKPGDELKKPEAKDVVSNIMGKNDWYELPDATLGLMDNVFGEGRDNTHHFMDNTFFELQVPENDFYIMPIFMGESGGEFQLFVSVYLGQDINDKPVYADYKLWNKWENLQYKLDKNARDWSKLDKDNNNGGHNTENAKAIRTKAIKVSVAKLPKGHKMHFYLKITKEASGYNKKDDVLGCLNGFIKEYPFNAGEVDLNNLPGIDKNSTDAVQCKFFGCEDASTSKSDKDFNDVVFLCYGQPHVPQSTKITNYYQYKQKRYLMEDLGETNDRDFNDVVVDVVETYTAKVETYQDGTPLSGYENPNYVKTGTKAYIRALGGTLDFELKIGTTTWRKSEEVKEWDWTSMENGNTINPDYDAPALFAFDVNGYNRNDNNVSLKVYQKDGVAVQGQVNFPATGTVPMMMATNTDFKWSKERGEVDFKSLMNQFNAETDE